jgi:hypothetical protein
MLQELRRKPRRTFDYDLAVWLYEAGEPIDEIASWAGVRRTSILTILPKAGARPDVRRMHLFWRKVTVTSNPRECWLWQGCKGRPAYGLTSFRGRPCSAHRLAFYYANGRWAENCVCHSCDTPSCVNPDHLFEGTHAENTADMIAKGRASFQTQPLKAPLAKVQHHVPEIRRRLKAGERRCDLAKEYGVHVNTIYRIKLGITYPETFFR